MRRGMAWIVAAIALVLVTGAARAAAEEYTYVGVKKCRSCHKKELIGDQYGAWQKTRHSLAFETLKGDKALELARKAGVTGPPHEAKECLKCHVTAYGRPASAFASEPLEHADGVQCESCHGPGSGYKKKKIMADHERSIAQGMWEPGKDPTICTTCHNDESPGWDAAVGFDFERAKQEIAHPIPEEVKGRYLEAEKELRAEKKARGASEAGAEED